MRARAASRDIPVKRLACAITCALRSCARATWARGRAVGAARACWEGSAAERFFARLLPHAREAHLEVVGVLPRARYGVPDALRPREGAAVGELGPRLAQRQHRPNALAHDRRGRAQRRGRLAQARLR